MMLTGCVSSGTTKIEAPGLQPIPSDIKVCFTKLVPKPVSGEMTKRQIVKLLGELKKSELAKSQCGKRLIAFYENQR